MSNFIDSLKQMVIFSYQDLMHMKNSISKNYAHLSTEDRAEILSTAIHNLLNKHLEGIDDAYRTPLRLDIIRNTLSKHIYNITKKDVFESIGTLDLPKDELIMLVEIWLDKNTGLNVSRQALDAYFDEPDVMIAYEAKRPRHLSAAVFLVLLISVLLMVVVSLHDFESDDTIIEHDQVLNLPGIPRGYQGLCSLDRVYLIYSLPNGTSIRETVPFGVYTGKLRRDFRFEPFHYFNVKHYIASSRQGLIAEPEYFNRLIHLAYLNDVDPLLLLAIIGQEQSFVSRDALYAMVIINNPFNVFHSWLDYNTTLRDSTKIAINTINKRLSKRPTYMPPLYWLGKIYAEDPNWHVGVDLIYAHLKVIGSP